MRLTYYVWIIVIFLPLSATAQIDKDVHDYRKADSIAVLYPDHSLRDLDSLAYKLTSSLQTQPEKFRAIYTWICNNIENDYDFYLINKKKREKIKDSEKLKAWNKSFNARAFKKLFNEKKTVCTGYAYLLRELALRAGLNCIIIDGYGRTVHANIRGNGVANHSWNAVELNDQWYLCDATWSSGAINIEQQTFIKKFEEAYFLADLKLFVRNHYPLDTAWMLLNNKPTLNDFLNGPLIYSSIYKYKVTPLLPKTFDVDVVKGETLTFQSQSGTILEKIELQVKGSGRNQSIFPRFDQREDGLYNIHHTFKTKGVHQVHIFINNEPAITYTVKVK